MSEPPRVFRVMDDRRLPRYGDVETPVRALPWSAVEPIRQRALKVHDQTLERLNERGGLSPQELWCHFHMLDAFATKTWDEMPTLDALRVWLRGLT